MIKLVIIFSVIILMVFFFVPVLAEEMSSANYKIKADSINLGGNLGATANYQLNDTVGEVAADFSNTSFYKLYAGYQQMHEVYISISSSATVAMSPNINGTSGGQSNGTATVSVTTDSYSGYSLKAKASASPALVSGANSFADYTTLVLGVPDYTWSVASSASEFGYTVEGSDIIQLFKDNGSSCNAAGGSDTAGACWYKFTTSDQEIANSITANHLAGKDTTVKFKVESGASNVQVAGDYQATVTFTAVAN